MGLNKLSGALQALIRRLGYHLSGLSLSAALDRVSSRSLEIGTVIDVGASNGQWSQIARQYYPDAFYFLMEANEVHEPALRLIKQKFPNVDYILAAVGDIVGEIFFDARDSFGGLASHTPIENSSSIRVPVVTIDTEVTKRNLKPPFLIKLDTHGFEVPIFEGAKHTLMQTNLIVVETYNFKLTKDSLMFYEMCSYLVSKGFRCIDLCDPMHRLKDKALWQFDLFFVPSTSKEFESNDYDS